MRIFLFALFVAGFVACAEPSSPTVSDQPAWRWDEATGSAPSLYLPELTAGEIAAAQRAGARDVIVPIGGLEQNGPHVVTAKHDLVVTALAQSIAKARGQTLVSQTVSFVPQGRFEPVTGHLRYPGTIGVSEETYIALLSDIVRSLMITGFDRVFLIGDSGGNQAGMRAVAEAFDGVYAIKEFYTDDYLDREFLATLGITETDGDIHTTYRHEAMLAALDPQFIRYADRMEKGVFINAVASDDVKALQAHGEQIMVYRTQLAVDAIARATGP